MKKICKFLIIDILIILFLLSMWHLDIVFHERNKKDNLYEEKYYQVFTNQLIEKKIEDDNVPEEIEESEEESFEIIINEDDVKILGNVLYGEARGLGNTERSAVIWCILNRVDSNKFPNTIKEVVEQPYQFNGYNKNRIYKSDAAKEVLQSCEDLSRNVLERYYREKNNGENVGRTLPSDYLFFYGKDGHNKFRKTWKGTDLWDWSLGTPYED